MDQIFLYLTQKPAKAPNFQDVDVNSEWFTLIVLQLYLRVRGY